MSGHEQLFMGPTHMRTANNNKSKKPGVNQSKTPDTNLQKNGTSQQNAGQQQQSGQQPNDLYFSMINEMLDAERQITEALPKIIEFAKSSELKNSLTTHLQETKEQVNRLAQAMQQMSKQEQQSDSKTMKTLLQEGQKMVEKTPEGDLRDLAIIVACRKVEYLEMSAYQSLMAMADMLQLEPHLDLLGKTLDEEENAARKLGNAARMLNFSDRGQADEMKTWPPFGAEDDDKENLQMRSSERERDSQGRFMNDDDDRDYNRGGGGRGSSNRGNDRGWYGDPQGHSEAAREGWRHREDDRSYSSRSRGDYDDDRDGRSNYGRGNSGGGDRGQGQGWYGDPQGHSEAAREGWRNRDDYGGGRGGNRGGRDYDDDDRGGRSDYGRGGGGDRGQGQGWYGDPQGHSEAAREGWRHRDDYGGNRGGNRGRDDDDDRGRSNYGRGGGGGRGQGGWFGDSEGHSEAAREGWRHRDDYSGNRGRGGRD